LIFASSNFDCPPSLLQDHTKQICLPDSQPKKRSSKHITIADSPTTLSQSTIVRANYVTPQTSWKARKHHTRLSYQNQEVGKMARKLSSVSAMMATMLQLCVWPMNLIHPSQIKYQRNGKKPVISQASLSTREAAMLLEDDKHHGDRQVQLIQQEIERRQT
jgi:hypothetical protein